MTSSKAEEREARRSRVRIWVTYGAALFLFAGGASLTGLFMLVGLYAEAKDLFMTILPVSAAVVSYWFATRSQNAKGGTSNTDQVGPEEG